ncbi:28S ribosomal protein S11, mitochondrial-like [Gigantopelta aegis]|uniref:28S ribosomal protein S11, mitochondrial-like n=1 Tax=Gigantopelta aegis TaxID=1735272 RepID=UPI001B88B2AD|nr:28S ribosomal protein S11, mitochondrial-like [Gigantopelta aegis]XP_041362428.1 28S ribosomal protein S11, mitochondrial-like [Gigantopelta aegis]XP_041362435.1 28S ribosomal protein S11, mitochondrial-like [Gigantopelta aegis]
MMMRSAAASLRLPYTCLVAAANQLRTYNHLPCLARSLHHSPVCQTLDRDHPFKKFVSKKPGEMDELATPEGEVGEEKIEEFRPGTLFPTLETNAMAIGSVRFDELPIVHVKATPSNTVLCTTDYKGMPVASESAGTVGFRNARKGTNIAAQAAGLSLGEKSVKKGITNVRVCLNGLGPGRMPAVKGLQMAGITIISVTDTTKHCHNGRNKPRKARRL